MQMIYSLLQSLNTNTVYVLANNITGLLKLFPEYPDRWLYVYGS